MIYFRSVKRLTAPDTEPVSVADAKAHLRVDIDTDDSYIASLISTAREWVEDYLDRTLIHTEWRMKVDAFPGEFSMPRPPMASSGTCTAVTITYTVNDTGSTATLSSSSYRVDRDSTPGAIRTLYGQSWPSHLNDQNSVTVSWWGGYGATAADVPKAARHAVLMLVAAWYERRTAIDNVSASEIPFGVKALLDTVRWGSYQ